ncbi:MAG: signal peptidase II [Patescibacteria group bacterium]|nr:signal peptidase II [Patescibacteria group bacterium]
MSKNKKFYLKILFIILFLFILDRYLKFTAVSYPTNTVQIIDNLLQFNFVPNYNIAFSLPIYGVWLNFIIILIIFVLLYFCVIFFKSKEYKKIIYMFFIIFGAISNLTDRLEYGYVIDYFSLKHFTIFNLADVMIVIGVFCLFKKIAILFYAKQNRH